ASVTRDETVARRNMRSTRGDIHYGRNGVAPRDEQAKCSSRRIGATVGADRSPTRSGPISDRPIVETVALRLGLVAAEVPAAARLASRTAADRVPADLLPAPPALEVAAGVGREPGRVPPERQRAV